MNGAMFKKTAVILAAGNGSRLAGDKSRPAPSKPLTLLAGVPLIVRTLMTLQRAGFQRAVIVTGYRADEVESTLAADRRVTLELVFARNERWRMSNGVSALAAAPHVDVPGFYLLMSDHVFERRILDVLGRASLDPEGALLAVDHKLGQIFDMDDATKVATDGQGRIVRIGKTLERFDAVDTGVFRCTRALFDALNVAYAQRGDCSLSEGIAQLAGRGRMGAVDVGAAWWQDVDTPESMAHARRLLLEAALRSPTGIIAPALGRQPAAVTPAPRPAASARPRLQ